MPELLLWCAFLHHPLINCRIPKEIHLLAGTFWLAQLRATRQRCRWQCRGWGKSFDYNCGWLQRWLDFAAQSCQANMQMMVPWVYTFYSGLYSLWLYCKTVIPEGDDWENVKIAPYLHSEASHSLPTQLIATIFVLNERLQYKLHEDVLISF
jgi:hypothetical protein